MESSLYDDDLVTGADNVQDAFRFHANSKSLVSCAGMTSCKWNSNSVELLPFIKGVNSQSPEMAKNPA